MRGQAPRRRPPPAPAGASALHPLPAMPAGQVVVPVSQSPGTGQLQEAGLSFMPAVAHLAIGSETTVRVVLADVTDLYGYQFEDINWTQGRNYSGPAYTTYFPNLVEDGVGTLGFPAACAAPYSLSDPACYTSFLSSTGPSLTVYGTGTPADPTDDVWEVTRTDFIPPSDPTNAKETNYFAQVSWDVISNVTVKAGLRYTEQELTGSGDITLLKVMVNINKKLREKIIKYADSAYRPVHQTRQ